MTGPVVVAGDGVGAAVLACRLLDEDVPVTLLTRRRRGRRVNAGVEALPEAAIRLLGEVGLGAALPEAGATLVDGFVNASGPRDAHRLEGVWAHVPRDRLARAVVTAARHRGAAVLPVTDLGRPRPAPDGGVEVVADGIRLRARAAIDATGRAARWSRPIERDRADTAVLFAAPGRARPRPGRLVRYQEGWAYRLEHPDSTTVGVLGRRPDCDRLPPAVAIALDVDPATVVRTTVRAAAVQWARDPVGPARLAIGDAALALHPTAGQGVRFTISSAVAAAAVLRSWDDEPELAAGYYRSFVDGVRRRHRSRLAAPPSTAPELVPEPWQDPVRLLHWTAEVRRVGTARDGRIVADACCVLPDGGLVRWVGGVDLLGLRTVTGGGATAAELSVRLAHLGVRPDQAPAFVGWALKVGVLG